jgi:hypothetical protein
VIGQRPNAIFTRTADRRKQVPDYNIERRRRSRARILKRAIINGLVRASVKKDRRRRSVYEARRFVR